MVVYVNGVEAARYLMNNGEVTYNTFASTYANNNPDSGQLTLPASLFKRGNNTIAVEIHNNNASSSDIYFDAALTMLTYNGEDSFISQDEEFVMPSSGNLSLIACYEPLTEEELGETYATPVKINEICASNSVYVNEYFEKNDWIELYNTTSEDFDIAGMYLSDNINKPTKFQISGGDDINTIIEPYSHLIIWADKLVTMTQLHASFKLAAEGGHILLTSADQTWRDILYYEPHLGTESVGLFPDGSNDVYVMSTPTIAKTNIINSYAAWLEQPEDSEPDHIDMETMATDGISLDYQGRALYIHSSTATSVAVTLYDITGRQHLRKSISLNAGCATINLSSLAAGTYIAAVTDPSGETQTLKICIR